MKTSLFAVFIAFSFLMLVFSCATGAPSGFVPYPEPDYVYNETDPETIAPGNLFYVAKNGDDSNLGKTINEPWLTIRKAADTLTAGQKVYVREGVYDEYVDVKYSGSAGAPIIFSAYPGERVVIEGNKSGTHDPFLGVFTVNAKQFIKIKGFKVRKANGTGIFARDSSDVTIEDNLTYDTWSSGVGVWNSSNVVIDGNEVILACNDGTQECISAAGCHHFEVMNNKVHHSGPGTSGGEGIDAKHGDTGTVHGNIVHDNNRLGIYVDAWDTETFDIEVYDNVCYNNHSWGICCAAEDGGLLHDISFYNNLCYDNDLVGIGIESWGEPTSHPMQDISIYNNTCYANGNANSGSWSGGIHVNGPEVTGVVYIGNNILSQNGGQQLSVETDGTPPGLMIENNLFDGPGGAQGSGAVIDDPLFQSAATHNFHLSDGSPAIDKAAATRVPAEDFDGRSRPQGAGYDIGAFEY